MPCISEFSNPIRPTSNRNQCNGFKWQKFSRLYKFVPAIQLTSTFLLKFGGKLGQLFCIPSGRKVSLSHLEHPTNCGPVQRSRFDVITRFTGPKEGNVFDRTSIASICIGRFKVPFVIKKKKIIVNLVSNWMHDIFVLFHLYHLHTNMSNEANNILYIDKDMKFYSNFHWIPFFFCVCVMLTSKQILWRSLFNMKNKNVLFCHY